MKKINKVFIFILSIVFLINFGVSSVFALEVIYPTVPGLPIITDSSSIGHYVGYFFGLIVYASGFIALLSLAIASFQYVASAGDSGMITSAKDRIKGAIIGLVLTMSSFIIIQTINPVLITPALTPLSGVAGVFYTNGSEDKPCPAQESNTAIIPTGFNSIKYKCNGTDGPSLFIWKYPNENFKGNSGGYEGIEVKEMTCSSSSESLGGFKSFKTSFKTPGIYYFLNTNCSGYMSGPNLSSGVIQDEFNNVSKSIKIINDEVNPFSPMYYGFILHKDLDNEKGGLCSNPYLSVPSDPAGNCFNIPNEMSSIDIFVWNEDPKISGDGVYFYSKPFDKSVAADAGSIKITNDKIDTTAHMWAGDASSEDMEFDYTDVTATDQEKENCQFFRDCPGSILILNNYLVALQSANGYCQTFTKNVKNLQTEEYVAASGRPVGDVIIIPIKR